MEFDAACANKYRAMIEMESGGKLYTGVASQGSHV